MAKDLLVKTGDELEEVILEISNIEAEYAEKLAPLKERELELRATAVTGLAKKGLEMIRTTSGLVFVMVKGRVSHKVIKGREKDALDWAIKEFPGVLSIAAAKLNSVVRPMLTLPSFIERVQSEPHLSVRTTEE